ncbi:MAG TPA: PD-(D/E)XK nuclease family protein, partial [bacterium]|nr:PD-(D/E)XK nuclease family protein [bacterium]
MLRILTAPFSCREGTRRLFELALAGENGPDFSGLWYIAPTPVKTREARRLFNQSTGRAAFIPPRFYTPKQLANDLFENFGTANRFPDDLKPLLLAHLRTPLDQPAENTNRFGFTRFLAGSIKEIKQYLPDQSPAALKERLPTLFDRSPDQLQKMLDNLDLMAEYDRFLKRHDFLDSEDIQRAAPKLTDRLEPGPKTLLLDGFYDLTPVEANLLKALLRRSERTIALAYHDPSEPEVYHIPNLFLEFLKDCAPFEICHLKPDPGPGRAAEYCELPDRETELELIAGLIKKAVLTEGVAPEKILVAFPDPAPYQKLAERTFARFGIPLRLEAEIPLDQLAAAEPILSLLACLENDFPRRYLAALIGAPALPRLAPRLRDAFPRLSSRAGLNRGREAWRSLAWRLSRDPVAGDRLQEEGWSDQDLTAFQAELDQLLKVAAGLTRPRQDQLAGFLSRLRALLTKFGWDEFLAGEPETVRESFYSLFNRLEDFGQRLLEDRKIDFVCFARMLRHLLGQAAAGAESEGVAALSFLDTRGLSPERCFVAGLAEASLPRRPAFDPILPEFVKKALGLPERSGHLERERLHFRRLERLPAAGFFSFPRTSGDTLFLPSPFLLDRTRRFPDRPAGLFSRAEVQAAAGRGKPVGRPDEPDLSADPVALEIIKARFGPNQRIRITWLDDYLRCPISFFFERVLRLERTSEPAYSVEPKVWGQLAHEVLEKLHQPGPAEPTGIPDRLVAVLTE